jgi:pimeloyl-ACP methyl ester carboxylesterase
MKCMKSSIEVQRGFARGTDVAIEFLSQGKGPIVLILPSLGRGAEDYDEIAALLEIEGFHVVRLQPRGIGDSNGPMADLTLVDLANDVALVIEAVASSPVIVAGHAFGNFVARMLATVRPELVRGVALVASSPGKTANGEPPYTPDVWESIFKSGDLSLPEAVRLTHLQHAFFAPGNDPRVWLGGWYPEVKASQSAALSRSPIDDYFAAGTIPILDLQAECDTVAPRKHAQVLKDALGARVTVEVIAGAGHALVPERPQEVSRSIAAWIRCLGMSNGSM